MHSRRIGPAATVIELGIALGLALSIGGAAPAGVANLVGHWKLDHGGADDEALDSSGNGNHGALLNMDAAAWVGGEIGGALEFDGMDDKVDVPYSADLNPDQFTFALWVKPNGGSGSYRSPLTCRQNSPQGGYILYENLSDVWSFWIGNGTGYPSLDGPAVLDGEWQHVACTYDGTTTTMYVAGEEVASGSATLTKNTLRPLRIGGGGTEGDGDYFYPGLVDDVRIYNVVLTEAEIAQLMVATDVTIVATDPDATEGDPATDTGTFTVTRKGDLSGDLTVRLNVLLGSATPGDDYIALADTVVILVGEATATITVTPVNDELQEPEEYVIIEVLADPAYNLGSKTLDTVTIVDDDVPGDFTLIEPGDEAGGEKEVALTPNLQWNAPSAPTADTYTVVMARDAGFTGVVYTEPGLTDTQWTVDSGVLEDDWRVWWKVVAYNGSGSTESNVLNFWTPDTKPPYVASFEPGGDADIESKVKIRFSEPVTLAGPLDAIFSIVEEGGTQPHPGDWASVSAYEVTFTPSEDFAYDTRYTVTVAAASVEDNAGWDLDGDRDEVQGGDYTQTFRTWQELAGLASGDGCVPGTGGADLGALFGVMGAMTAAALALSRTRGCSETA